MEARLQSLKKEFDVINMKEGEKVDDFVARLLGIASKSTLLGTVIAESIMVKKLLTSMPESYIHMVATIEQLVELKTVKFQEIVGKLKAYEERVGMRTSKTNSGKLLLSYEEWEAKKRNMGRGRGSSQDGCGRGRGRGRGRSNNRTTESGEVLGEKGDRITNNPTRTRKKIEPIFSASGAIVMGIFQPTVQQENKILKQTLPRQPK